MNQQLWISTYVKLVTQAYNFDLCCAFAGDSQSDISLSFVTDVLQLKATWPISAIVPYILELILLTL